MGWFLCSGKSNQATKKKRKKPVDQIQVQTTSEKLKANPSFNVKEASKNGGPDHIAAQTFTFRELAAATKNFRGECLLGEGGFGRVYKGRIANTNQAVAIKQLDRNGLQGNREFLVEVLMLSLLHHPNLVNLIGYCADGDQRLLVYEYMPLGSLEDHLHDVSLGKKRLDWNTRMKIAAGAAKGLEYLHDKASPPVIYRDLKCSNILLGEDFHPKLSDFGLAKLGPVGDNTHVSTRVMGTYGYCAPEYAMTGQLTLKSDVYSFGVVLLEIITGRKAIDNSKAAGEHNLVAWARPLFKDRRKFLHMGTDCQSLLKFKQGITGDPDGHLQDWNETMFFCNWTGITCHQQLKNRVIAIELINMRLEGVISPYISNLSHLTTLSLQGNSLYGGIPATIGELSELTFINMSGNKLGGNIPASIQGCWSLETIDLDYNNLTGSIPAVLGQMTNLTYLCLSENSLTGAIPSFLSNLTKLTDLELQVNYFTGRIPEELGALTKLEILYLHINFLEGSIPASISNCTALRHITLFENRLTGTIPLELGAKLHNLQRLYFQQNQLSGKIPVTLSNLSQLTLLDLSLNQLEGEVPPELGKLKKLERLYLHSNNLVSGSNNSSLSFLTPLTNCSRLQKLHLGACLFAGSLPASIGSLSKDLYYLNLRNNKITGDLPAEIGNLSGLVTLDLWYNFLNGVPATIGKLRQLQRLHLGRNKLLGPIPDELGQMANLGLLELSDNLISGTIPSSLGNLSQLRYLYLSHNHLTGKIPIQLTQCSLLMLLDLSFNNLQGSLPTEIGHFSNLALSLNLSNNNLQGELPASIGNLASVLAIDLSANKFFGVIPSSIGRCISMEYLNLSHNMLEGTIPESLKQIIDLGYLDLAFNNLTGNVPIWIGDSQKIKNLNLSYNRLTGEVPNSGRYKNLGSISFMGNMGLCGGTKLMGLHPCEILKQKHKKRKWIYYLFAIITCSLLLFVLIALTVRRFFFKNRSAGAETAILMCSPTHHGTQTLTEREIEIATGGFDEANLLGKGSFGRVYKAIINDGKTVVAVKVLQEECVQGYRSFKRECQILSEIRHRNLVRMIGSTWNSGFKAIVLEYIGNGNLEQHLYPGGSDEGGSELKLRERMGIAIDVANGLEYLHEGCPVQVVHCDLKPQNVLLDNDMVAHVADFGIGKLISGDKPRGHVTTTTAFLRGSVGYIPPEYGQGIDVSTRGDVYSFGVMMLEMITRKRPTNEMFSDGLDLRKWVCSAFPNQVLDIVDISLKHEAYLEEGSGALHKLEQCCIHMLDAGMMCTEENPQKCPLISSVAQRLKNVWKEMGFGTLYMAKEENVDMSLNSK